MEALSFLTAIGLAVGGVGYGLGQFRKGKNDSRKDAIGVSRETIDLMTAQVKALQDGLEQSKTEQRRQSDEIVKLRTIVEEKDKKLREYVEIIQGRDPQLRHFIERAEKFMSKMEPWIDKQIGP